MHERGIHPKKENKIGLALNSKVNTFPPKKRRVRGFIEIQIKKLITEYFLQMPGL